MAGLVLGIVMVVCGAKLIFDGIKKVFGKDD